MKTQLIRGQWPPAVVNLGDKKAIVDGNNWIHIPKSTTFAEAVKLYEAMTIPDKPVKDNLPKSQWRVKSSTEDKIYTVRRYGSGIWTCTCKGFYYRSECKHVNKCKELIKEE
jgi:hypothetical protein